MVRTRLLEVQASEATGTTRASLMVPVLPKYPGRPGGPSLPTTAVSPMNGSQVPGWGGAGPIPRPGIHPSGGRDGSCVLVQPLHSLGQ